MNDVAWSVRAEDDFGERHPDVSPDALDDLVAYVTSTGGYLVVERTDRPYGHWAQVVLEGPESRDVWAVEIRDGVACPYSRAVVNEIAEARRALRAWAFDESDWHTSLAWTQMPPQ